MSTTGVRVGRVIHVSPHPNGDRIRVAEVDLGTDAKLTIVFGGPDIVADGAFVPVAPPGARVPGSKRKLRRERFRGVESHGMLCSLVELGWVSDAPDEVALLTSVEAGQSLDSCNPAQRRRIVIEPPAERGVVDWAVQS